MVLAKKLLQLEWANLPARLWQCQSTSTKGPHEGIACVENHKGKVEVGFEPRLALVDAIQMTMDWYRSQLYGSDPRKLCEDDISNYEALI